MSSVSITGDIRIPGPDGAVIINRCDTKIKIHNANYLWVIHDYDFHKAKLTKGQNLRSPVFCATVDAVDDGCKWFLEIFPNGKEDSSNDNSFLYLGLDGSSERTEVFGKFKFSIFDDKLKEYVSECEEKLVKEFDASDNENGWGFSGFIEKCYKLESNDKLMIYCEVTFTYENPVTNSLDHFNSIKCQSKVPKYCLYKDVNKFFKNEEYTDVVISANGKEFRAHKFMLMARSPVFAAMFAHENVKENLQNKVKISDFDEQVVEEMLNYIYTNKSENLEKLADGLLAAAEKYGLDGLKEMSEELLIEKLSIDNATDTLVLADFHNADVLKFSSIDFIVAKSATVMNTTAWKNMASTHPQLVAEVCKVMAGKLTGNR